jgi:parvulin-like peptidyl-prolyl isomerase
MCQSAIMTLTRAHRRFCLAGRVQRPASERAENELIDEALQRAEARRLGISVTQAELDQALQTIASRSGLSVSQLGQALSQRGVDLASLRDSIEAQILWDQVIRARFQATVRVDEQDVLQHLTTARSDEMARSSQRQNTPCARWCSLCPKGPARMRESSAAARQQPSARALSPAASAYWPHASSTAWLSKTSLVGSPPILHPTLTQNLQETPVGQTYSA